MHLWYAFMLIILADLYGISFFVLKRLKFIKLPLDSQVSLDHS